MRYGVILRGYDDRIRVYSVHRSLREAGRKLAHAIKHERVISQAYVYDREDDVRWSRNAILDHYRKA